MSLQTSSHIVYTLCKGITNEAKAHTETPVHMSHTLPYAIALSGVKCDFGSEQNVFSVLQMKCDSFELKITAEINII